MNTTIPDIPLPPGADTASTWEEWEHEFRVIHTADRPIADTQAIAYASAIQSPDGNVDSELEPPQIWIEDRGDGLSIAQARSLAAVLLELADIADGWVQR